jgi:hypothetical protein
MDSKNVKRFTLAGVDKSVVNALRRTLVGNIPILVMKPQDCVITENTTRFTNEIIKSRLACIPVHHSSSIFDKFTISVHHTNQTQQTMYLTTNMFTVEQAGKKYDGKPLFPSYANTGLDGKTYDCYIEFMRLRPGETLSLTCETSIGTANESGMYNSVGTCAYGCTQDKKESDRAYKESDGQNEQDWNLLNAKRYVVANSFDFVLETVGVYTNQELLAYAIVVLNAQFEQCRAITTESVEESLTTMKNCFDVKITGDYHLQDPKDPLKQLDVRVEGDYTIGKMLEAQIFKRFHAAKTPITYVAFFKKHPHDKFGILRVAFESATAKSVLTLIQEASNECMGICMGILEQLKKKKILK